MSANTKDVDMLKDKDKAHDTYKYAHNKLVLVGDKIVINHQLKI